MQGLKLPPYTMCWAEAVIAQFTNKRTNLMYQTTGRKTIIVVCGIIENGNRECRNSPMKMGMNTRTRVRDSGSTNLGTRWPGIGTLGSSAALALVHRQKWKIYWNALLVHLEVWSDRHWHGQCQLIYQITEPWSSLLINTLKPESIRFTISFTNFNVHVNPYIAKRLHYMSNFYMQ